MTLFPLARSVTNRRADGGHPELRSLMAYRLWLMDVSPLPRSGFIPPSQQIMNFELSHDVVSACAKRDEPPSRRSRSIHWQSMFLFHHEILRKSSRPVCEAFCFFCVFSGLIMNIRVHSCSFVVDNQCLAFINPSPRYPQTWRFFGKMPRQNVSSANSLCMLASCWTTTVASSS